VSPIAFSQQVNAFNKIGAEQPTDVVRFHIRRYSW